MSFDPDRPRRPPLLPIPAVVLMIVGVFVWVLLLIDWQSSTPAVERLPHTDGAERFVQPSISEALSLARFQAAQLACDGPCVTDFGAPLGRADGVEARSNCVSICVRLESSFVDPESGRIRIVRIGERYSLIDVAPDQVENPGGGTIAGWVYPLPD